MPDTLSLLKTLDFRMKVKLLRLAPLHDLVPNFFSNLVIYSSHGWIQVFPNMLYYFISLFVVLILSYSSFKLHPNCTSHREIFLALDWKIWLNPHTLCPGLSHRALHAQRLSYALSLLVLLFVLLTKFNAWLRVEAPQISADWMNQNYLESRFKNTCPGWPPESSGLLVKTINSWARPWKFWFIRSSVGAESPHFTDLTL